MHECRQEPRIAKIESEMTGQNRDIQNLIKRLDSLTKGIWALVLMLMPATLSFFGFLIWQVISKK